MANKSSPDRSAAGTPASGSQAAATHEERLAASLPPYETEQPDPALQLSTGRMGAGAITLAAVAAAIILGVVLYGLNSPTPPQTAGTAQTASSAPASGGTSGSAAPARQPAKTGHS